LGERCFGTLGGLEPIKVSAKGLSGGGEKIGPLSARHGIAEILTYAGNAMILRLLVPD
jgi:hypothetical protein